MSWRRNLKLGQSGTAPQSAIAWKAPLRVAEIVRPRYVTRQPTGTRSRSRGVPHGISGLAPSCPIWLWATLFPVPLRPPLLVRRAPFRRPLSPEIQLPADAALALMGPNSGGPGQASRFHATRRGIRQLAAAGELCHPPDATQVRVAIRTRAASSQSRGSVHILKVGTLATGLDAGLQYACY